MKPKYLLNNLRKKDKEKGITLICCFSRSVVVPIFFKALQGMNLPRKNMHLLVYDNTNNIQLGEQLKDEVTAVSPDYLSVRLYKSNLQGRGSVAGSGNEKFSQGKLFNIWSMWKKVYNLVFTKEFFQLEDDTIAPPNAYKRLYGAFKKRPDAVLVTGISTGRTHVPWIPVRLGVHYLKMKGLKVLVRHSLNPETKGIVEVDGTGVYCFIANKKRFIAGFEGYDPVKLNVPFFALDNVFTYNMKKNGLKLYADFNVWVSHLQITPARIISFGKQQAQEQVDLWLPEYNNYAQGIEVKTKDQKPRRYQVKTHASSWQI